MSTGLFCVTLLQNEGRASTSREQVGLQKEVCEKALLLVLCHPRAWGRGVCRALGTPSSAEARPSLGWCESRVLCSLQPQLPSCPCARGLAAGPAPSSSAQDLESMSQHPRAQPSSPACTASLPGQAIFSCLDDSVVSPLPADDPHPLHSSWRDCSEAEIRSCRDVPQALRRHLMPSC